MLEQRPRFGELSANIVAFCRLLRGHGLPVGAAEEVDVLRALQLVRLVDSEEFRLTLRTVLAGSRKEQDIFDRLYDSYWNGKQRIQSSNVGQKIESWKNERPFHIPKSLNSWNRTIQAWNISDEDQQEMLPSYSPLEVLTRKNPREFDEDGFAEAIRLIRAIAHLLARRLSRRYRPSHQHRWIDFRKTMRLSLRNAGETIRLAFRQRQMRRSRIVLLCDVSGSMESYNHFVIAFMYILQQVYGRIETFVFSTSLHRVTDLLKEKDLAKAMNEIFALIPDWSGGTRIGQSLQTFLDEHTPGFLNKDTTVLILSDGWDIGETELTGQCMKQIHQRANRVIWLNPLLGNPEYEPSCSGMEAALPHVDLFLPADNLESLRNLYHHLLSEQKRRGLPR